MSKYVNKNVKRRLYASENNTLVKKCQIKLQILTPLWMQSRLIKDKTACTEYHISSIFIG